MSEMNAEFHEWLGLTGDESHYERGVRLERATKVYLQESSDYRDRFSEVYLWDEWPERDGHDDGIDLVAWDRQVDGWCAIQVKFYDADRALRKPDVDSFLSRASDRAFKSLLLVSSAEEYASPLEKHLSRLVAPFTRVSAHQMMASDVPWSVVDLSAPLVHIEFEPPARKTLRPHQQEALDAVFEGFDRGDRGKLVMACGTGKTFTSLKIVEELRDRLSKQGEQARVLFLAPSIALVNQTLREWQAERSEPFRAFAVCSDTKVGRTTEDISSVDLVIPATTDTEALRAKLDEPTDAQLTVVFSTYHSIEVVAKAQAGGTPFDLIVCDEAHRTTGVTLADSDESHFVRVHDNSFISADRRLYMTATPRLYGDESKKKASDAGAVVASMDDESVFGPEIFRLGFGEAVEQGLLTDYKVMVLAIQESYVSRNFQQVMSDHGELQIGDAAKIIGCWNGLAKRFTPEGRGAGVEPMRRAVAFTQTIAASKTLAGAFPAIVEKHIVADDVEEGQNLDVQVKHVDGGMNALEREKKLGWLKAEPDEGENSCRVLSNARCLSEGVDVPALDAVIFMTPRGSQVDIVQSVGRVMRRAPGKEVGYIVLPIAVPDGADATVALNDNKKYQVVWQVLQALRAHDERFQAMVNQIELSGTKPTDKLEIVDVTPREPGETGDALGETEDARGTKEEQLAFQLKFEEWQDALYAKIVDKVGERKYWETWAKDIAEIARLHIERISALIEDEGSPAREAFERFLDGLRANLNEGISADDAVEMLAQHLITRPVFDALFAGSHFAEHNPVAQTMESVLEVLDAHGVDDEAKKLEKFYASVRRRVEGVTDAQGRQKLIVELYDKFFAHAFPKTVSRLGIVYTPVEVVDFLLHSANEVLQKEFGQGLTDEGVHILDGFTGTGTFMVRLLQSGLIKPHDLARKYANELHANEILLLAYYIAAVNIETTYAEITGGSLADVADEGATDQANAEYKPFPGLVLTDTFQSWEEGDREDSELFVENNSRLSGLKDLDIRVIVGNPPYSVGQSSANDDNQNEKYEHLDAAIRDSYAARSEAQNKNSLYDSYIRAIKWATLRLKGKGVVAFVTNGGFLDGNTADGLRKCLVEDFTSIYVVNLRGNQRTAGEESRREGGKIFDAGSRATVTLIVLVANPDRQNADGIEHATIHYADIGDYLNREKKLERIKEQGSLAGTELRSINPNEHGDWINQRRDDFETFIPLSAKDEKLTVFGLMSAGVKTNRDAWCYNFSRSKVEENMQSCIDFANQQARSGVGEDVDRDPTKISWDYQNVRDVSRGLERPFVGEAFRVGAYRPFMMTNLYFDKHWNNRRYQLPKLFPTAGHPNWGFEINGSSSQRDFSTIIVGSIPDLHLLQTGQFFARYRYEEVKDDAGTLDVQLEADGEVVDGYRKIDNISAEGLAHFQSVYGKAFTTDDVFHYCYGLLHSPEYRATYAADLKKSLPRIPLVEDPAPFVEAGRRLAEIHLGYESAELYPLEGLDATPTKGGEYEFFRVEKMKFGKPSVEQKAAGERHDRSSIIYNSRITLRGIPEEAYRYQLGARSAIEWILDRYQVKTDKKSGIVNDPNDWSREVGDPRYILNLLARIVTVSLDTVEIVEALPPLAILDPQPPVKG